MSFGGLDGALLHFPLNQFGSLVSGEFWGGLGVLLNDVLGSVCDKFGRFGR